MPRHPPVPPSVPPRDVVSPRSVFSAIAADASAAGGRQVRPRDKVQDIDPATASPDADAEASAHPTTGGKPSLFRRGPVATGPHPPLEGPFTAMPRPQAGWRLAGVVTALVALGIAAGLLGLTSS